MKITVELTDEQADELHRCWKYLPSDGLVMTAALRVIRDAIVAARPKPLKVGDTVLSQYNGEMTVVALGRASGRGVGVAADGDTITLFSESKYNRDWTTADGSPIVWPE
jgi:hypothetical protein